MTFATAHPCRVDILLLLTTCFLFAGGQMMVTDLQGFESSILTDPQIHCVNKDLFGRGNLGKDGMDQCFEAETTPNATGSRRREDIC